MSFGLEMRRERKKVNLPDNQHIGEVEGEGYKYRTLGFTVGQTVNTKMKGKIISDYTRRV